MSRIIRALALSFAATALAAGAVFLLAGRNRRLSDAAEAGVPGEIDADEIGQDQAATLMRELGAQL